MVKIRVHPKAKVSYFPYLFVLSVALSATTALAPSFNAVSADLLVGTGGQAQNGGGSGGIGGGGGGGLNAPGGGGAGLFENGKDVGLDPKSGGDGGQIGGGGGAGSSDAAAGKGSTGGSDGTIQGQGGNARSWDKSVGILNPDSHAYDYNLGAGSASYEIISIGGGGAGGGSQNGVAGEKGSDGALALTSGAQVTADQVAIGGAGGGAGGQSAGGAGGNGTLNLDQGAILTVKETLVVGGFDGGKAGDNAGGKGGTGTFNLKGDLNFGDALGFYKDASRKFWIREGSTLNLDGGTIKGITTFTNDGLININGGTITTNIINSDSDKGQLIKQTDATAIINSDVTFGKGVVINGGTLQIGSGGTTGTVTGDINLNSGSLTYNRSDTYSVDNNIYVSPYTTLNFIGGTVNWNANVPGRIANIHVNLQSSTVNVADFYKSLRFSTPNSIYNIDKDSKLTLNIVGAGSLTLPIKFQGSGTLEFTGERKFTLNNQQDFEGTIIVNIPSLTLGENTILGWVDADIINNTTFNFNNSSTNTFTHIISGPGNVNYQAGTVILTNANTYSGGTNIDSGATLQLGNGEASGNIVGDVSNNGTLSFNRSDTYTFAGNVSGMGGVNQIGSGTTILTGDNTYSGGTAINGGTLQISRSENLGDASGGLSFGRGTLQTLADMNLAPQVTIAQEGVFDVLDKHVTLTGAVGGEGRLVKDNTGTLTLTNDANNVAGVFVKAGELEIGNGEGRGQFSFETQIENNATVRFNRSANDQDHSTYKGAMTGTGQLIKDNVDTLILTGANTYSGGTRIEAGTLQLGDGGTGGSILGDVSNDGTLSFNRSDTYTFAGNVSGMGGVNQMGSGTTILTNNNTYRGGTRIEAGTLEVSSDSNLGDTSGGLSFNDGRLAVSDSFSSDRKVTLDQQGRFDIADSKTLTLGGEISGAGRFVKQGAGVLKLNADNTYRGGTAIDSGTLQISRSENLGDASGGLSFGRGTLQTLADMNLAPQVTISQEGVFDVLDKHVTLTGAVGGEGRLVKDNTGTLTLTNDANNVASVFVKAGELEIGNGEGRGQFSFETQIENNATVRFNRSANDQDHSTYKGAMTGTGQLIKDNVDTLILTGANTYSGGTRIEGGTLQLGDGGTGGSLSGDVSNSGTLSFNRSDTYTFAGNVSGMGEINQMGSGTTILSGDLTYQGASVVDKGTLQLGDGQSVSQVHLGGSLTVHKGSALSVNSPNIVYVDKEVAFGEGTRFDLTDHQAKTSIIGNMEMKHLTLGENVVFNLTGVSNKQALKKVLFTTKDGISGDFSKVTVGGFSSDVDYMTLHAYKEGNAYVADYGLSWYANNNLAHGTFTLNEGERFNVATDLSNVAANSEKNWDGKSLIKQGAGTLILTGANTYSGGTRIAGGTLQLGDGGTGGSILGDVSNDGTLSFNRSDAYTFAGNVSGMGGVNQMGSGTTILSGINTYRGGTRIEAGTLEVSSDSNLGDKSGDLSFNDGRLAVSDSFSSDRKVTLDQQGRFDIADSKTLMLEGEVKGNGRLIKENIGFLKLTNNNTYRGGTRIEAGTLEVSSDSNLGDRSGDLSFNDGRLAVSDSFSSDRKVTLDQQGRFDIADSKTLTLGGEVKGNGRLVKENIGTLILTGANTYRGGTQIEGGTLQLGDGSTDGSLTSDVMVNRGSKLIFNQQDFYTYAGVLSGSGDIYKDNKNLLRLTGDSSSFTGTTQVYGGTLLVGLSGGNGRLGGDITVYDHATLGGYGTLGSGTWSKVQLNNGATISPGNSLGTLTIKGNLNFSPTATYRVETDPLSDKSDLIYVTGQAQLNNALVHHIGLDGAYKPTAEYKILTADGGVLGKFSQIKTDFVFLEPLLNYDTNNVYLKFIRNNVPICDSGSSANQNNAACNIPQPNDNGSGGGGSGNGSNSHGGNHWPDGGDHANGQNGIDESPLYDAVINLTREELPYALDQLTGEMHASVRSSLIEDSRFVRDGTLNRLRSAFSGIGSYQAPVVVLGASGYEPGPASSDKPAFWMQGFGSWGSRDTSSNLAGLRRTLSGVLLGVDASYDNLYRYGMVTGYGYSTLKVNERHSSASVKSYYLGAYGGRRFDDLRVTGGANYTWNRVDSSRLVSFRNFNESENADYHGGILQIYGEAAYKLTYKSMGVEPFAQAIYLRSSTDGFSEQGAYRGDPRRAYAKLSVERDVMQTGFSNIGLRVEQDLSLGFMNGTVGSGLSWRHAYADVTPTSKTRYTYGGLNSFDVDGIPIVKDALVLEAHVGFKFIHDLNIDVSYEGQMSAKAQDHALKLNMSKQW